eukprot:261334-Chlamydomonas_euryale.AAC.4
MQSLWSRLWYTLGRMSGDGGSGVPNDRLIAVLDGGDGHQETVMVEDEQNNPVAYGERPIRPRESGLCVCMRLRRRSGNGG